MQSGAGLAFTAAQAVEGDGETVGFVANLLDQVQDRGMAVEDAGLVLDCKEGTRRLYQLNPAGVARLRAHFDQMWTNALSAFQAAAEKKPKGERKKNVKPRRRSGRS